jgi:lysophospholipase L1-like esterase
LAALHESNYSRWESSIASYEQKDDDDAPPPGGIVFVGSSSIRGWKTLAEDFPGLPVIGRGFGGSQLIDSTMYAHRIVLPYRPAAVAIYAGDNDIGYGKSAEQVFRDFKVLAATLHAADPKLEIGFIAIKPSLKRWQLWPDMDRANRMVADLAASDERITYLDVATPMLGSDGKPLKEFFVKDGLHMTRAGYKTWASVVRPWAQSVHASN